MIFVQLGKCNIAALDDQVASSILPRNQSPFHPIQLRSDARSRKAAKLVWKFYFYIIYVREIGNNIPEQYIPINSIFDCVCTTHQFLI